jgi:hypothetical protein
MPKREFPMELDEKKASHTVGVDQKKSYRVGGIAALLLATGYVVIVPLYAQVGAPPSGGDAWFKYVAGKATIWWWIVALSVFTDFLFVPVAWALYLALKEAGKNGMLLATVFVGLFVVLDLGVTWSHYTSILTLYSQYSAATDEAQRMGYVAAANYGSAMLTSRLEIVYSIVTLSFGILVIGFVMLRGVFHKITAYLGLATGILGIAAPTRLSVAIIGNALCATAWLFLVGYRLYQLAQDTPAGGRTGAMIPRKD